MDENKGLTSISKEKTMEGVAEFWDSHSLADYWDQTKEVEFKVKAHRRRRIAIEPDVYTQIENYARKRGVLPETIVNLWLVEKLRGAT